MLQQGNYTHINRTWRKSLLLFQKQQCYWKDRCNILIISTSTDNRLWGGRTHQESPSHYYDYSAVFHIMTISQNWSHCHIIEHRRVPVANAMQCQIHKQDEVLRGSDIWLCGYACWWVSLERQRETETRLQTTLNRRTDGLTFDFLELL